MASFVTKENSYQLTFDELADMGEEFTPQGTTATRVIQVAWSDHYKVAPAFLGWQTLRRGDVPALRREPPEKHPRYPWLFCNSVKLLRGVGACILDTNSVQTNESGNYPGGYSKFVNAANEDGKAVYEIHYEDVPYDVLDDARADQISPGGVDLSRFVTRTKQWMVESLDAKGGGFQWTADNKKIAEGIRVPYRMAQLEYKWWWVPEPLDESFIANTLGKVNSTTFDASTFAVDAGNYTTEETVYFHTYHTERVRDALGQKCVHITFQFLFRPDGWNKVYRVNGAGGPGFYSCNAADGSGVKPFSSANLNQLFIPPI